MGRLSTQNFSVQYCATQLCTTMGTLICTVLTGELNCIRIRIWICACSCIFTRPGLFALVLVILCV